MLGWFAPSYINMALAKRIHNNMPARTNDRSVLAGAAIFSQRTKLNKNQETDRRVICLVPLAGMAKACDALSAPWEMVRNDSIEAFELEIAEPTILVG